MAGVAGLVLAVATAGTVSAYQVLGGGGPQPAEALPATTVGYVRIDLDPSAAQKVQALRLLSRFPSFAEASGIDDEDADLRRELFEQLDKNSEELACIDYDADIEPWLGERAGFGFAPSAGGDADVLLTVAVTDPARALDGMTAVLDCLGENAPGFALVGDYLLLAETQAVAQQYAEQARALSLADNPAFGSDMDLLGEQGVLSWWVDVGALTAITDEAFGREGEALAGTTGRVAGAVRFDDRYLEFAAVSTGGDFAPPLEQVDNPIADLPRSTFAAMSVSNGQEYVVPAWEALREEVARDGGDLDADVAEFERETGLRLPADIAVLLGSSMTWSLNGEGLDISALGDVEDPADLDVGLELSTDVDRAREIVDAMQDLAADSEEPVEVIEVVTDDSLVLATNEQYADRLTVDGGLGDLEAFTEAVPDPDAAQFVFYLNLAALERGAIDVLGDMDVPPEFIDNLEPIQALGISWTVTGFGEMSGSVRIVVG